VQRVLALFAQGLSGRYLHLRPTDTLTGSFRPDGVTTDGTVHLPARVGWPTSSHVPRHNLGVYRISPCCTSWASTRPARFEFSFDEARTRLPRAAARTRPAKGCCAGARCLARVGAPTSTASSRLWEGPAADAPDVHDARGPAHRSRRCCVATPGARADLERVLAHALAGRPDADTLAGRPIA
jgi:hypothetical protein